jgi:hypothetical protein
MHVRKLFLDLPPRKQIEAVIPRLPHRLRDIERLSIFYKVLAQQLLDAYAARALPLLQVLAQLPMFREPKDRMHVVWHNDKADAQPAKSAQLRR